MNKLICEIMFKIFKKRTVIYPATRVEPGEAHLDFRFISFEYNEQWIDCEYQIWIHIKKGKDMFL